MARKKEARPGWLPARASAFVIDRDAAEDTRPLAYRQAHWIAARFRLTAIHAQLIADLAFSNAREARR